MPRDYFDEFFDPHDDCTMNGAITIMKTTITGAIMIRKIVGDSRTVVFHSYKFNWVLLP